MTALIDKNNPNVVSHSKFESTSQESTDEHVEIEEEPSLEPAAILAPSQRQQYFEKPAIRGRIVLLITKIIGYNMVVGLDRKQQNRGIALRNMTDQMILEKIWKLSIHIVYGQGLLAVEES